eukprot:2853899-Prorocentrum_lima.AAC.1
MRTRRARKQWCVSSLALNTVCGVGGSSNAVRTKAKVPIDIEGLGDLSFEGSVLDNGDVPALL